MEPRSAAAFYYVSPSRGLMLLFDVPHINIINIITLLWNALREISWELLVGAG